jgi:uncharacterized phage protein gp47/JayE
MVNVQPVPQTSPAIQIPTSIDYTSRDYTGMMNSLILFASQVFPDWNFNSEGDFGVVLLELFAYVGDINSYYTDRIAQEAYLPTATQRQSLLNIAQLLGYVPSNGTPATGTVTFQTDNPGSAVVIPEGTRVQSNFNTALDQPIIYYTLAQVTCPANGGQVTANVSQGTQFFGVAIGTSSGLPGQEFQLPQLGILDNSTTIFIQSTAPGGSTQWSQVSSFIDSGDSDTVFTLFVDANGATNIIFGDGTNGLVPGLGLTIFASFTTIVGAAGNQPAGSINIMVDTITGVSIAFNSVNVPITSELGGGSDAESNDSIRANAPIQFATQDRAVSLQDYSNLALSIPGVVVAAAVANHSTSVSLYVLGPNITVPTAQLQAQILEFFVGKTLAGVSLSLPTPNLIAVDVGSNATPFILQVLPTFSQQATVNAVVQALNNLLTPPNTSFGMLLQVSSIYQTIMAVAGVQYVVVPVFTREDIIQTGVTAIQFRASEIPIAGNYVITAQGGL